MKLGVLTSLYKYKRLEYVLGHLSDLGVQAVELGTGGYPESNYIDIDRLLNDDMETAGLKNLLRIHKMEISALSCHGNPVHPQKEIAERYHQDYIKTVLLAEKLNINSVITFSGCPGDSSDSKHPNWVTCPWPDEYMDVLDYQWNNVLIPYWEQAAKFAEDHGVEKIAIEMHPGFCVYNPETLLKLRSAIGNTIGANFDPSHLFWQGINPVNAIRKLNSAIYYVHAKDTRIDEINTAVNGVLDTKHYSDEINRSWIFRTVGYGHDISVWKDIVSNLLMVGYDGVLSIEHEDSLLTVDEGLEKAIAFLKQAIAYEGKGKMCWV